MFVHFGHFMNIEAVFRYSDYKDRQNILYLTICDHILVNWMRNVARRLLGSFLDQFWIMPPICLHGDPVCKPRMIERLNFAGTLLVLIPNDPDHFQLNPTSFRKKFIFVHFGHFMNIETVFRYSDYKDR